MDIYSTFDIVVCDILIHYLTSGEIIQLAHTCQHFYYTIQYLQRPSSCIPCEQQKQLCIRNECRLCRRQICLNEGTKSCRVKITNNGILYSNIQVECRNCTQCHKCHDTTRHLSFCVSCQNKYCPDHSRMIDTPEKYCGGQHRLHGSLAKRIVCQKCHVKNCPVSATVHCTKCHHMACQPIIRQRKQSGKIQKCANCPLFSDIICPLCANGFCQKHSHKCRTCDSFMCTRCCFVDGDITTCWNCKQFSEEMRCSTCQYRMTYEPKRRQCIQCQRIVCKKCKIHGCVTCHRSICDTCKIGSFCTQCYKN